MKAEDFKISHCPSGKTQYLHIENGKKREQILDAMKNGIMTSEEFKSIRAQKVALEKAAENAEIICKRKTVNCKQCYGGGCENPIVERESITNPENLVR